MEGRGSGSSSAGDSSQGFLGNFNPFEDATTTTKIKKNIRIQGCVGVRLAQAMPTSTVVLVR